MDETKQGTGSSVANPFRTKLTAAPTVAILSSEAHRRASALVGVYGGFSVLVLLLVALRT